jgi:hypothetical protein
LTPMLLDADCDALVYRTSSFHPAH